MRFAFGSLVCSFALAGAVLGQELIDPVTTPGEFLEQAQGAPAPPAVDIAPIDVVPTQIAPIQVAPPRVAPQPRTVPVDDPPRDVTPADVVPSRHGEADSPQRIQFEASISHFASPDVFTAEEQAVTAETVDDLRLRWTAQGFLERTSTLRLTSVDNVEAFVQIGEQVPVTVSRTSGSGRGGSTQAVSYQDVGSILRVRGQTQARGIRVECTVEESRVQPSRPMSAPAPTVAAGEGSATPEDGLDLRSVRKLNSETVVFVSDGETAIISSSFQMTSDGSRATIVTLKASTLP